MIFSRFGTNGTVGQGKGHFVPLSHPKGFAGNVIAIPSQGSWSAESAYFFGNLDTSGDQYKAK